MWTIGPVEHRDGTYYTELRFGALADGTPEAVYPVSFADDEPFLNGVSAKNRDDVIREEALRRQQEPHDV